MVMGRPRKVERNAQIVAAIRAGETRVAVARRHGVTDGVVLKIWRRDGDGTPAKPVSGDPLTRLMAGITRQGDCWLYRRRSSNGYGCFYTAGRQRVAHRVAYELLVGPVPAGLELDHLCRVPPCVNPAHLEPVTHSENLRRAVRKAAA